ncbi:MAG: hypothetical protein WKF94_03645 [Solirubrobacteraceae bacterium]
MWAALKKAGEWAMNAGRDIKQFVGGAIDWLRPKIAWLINALKDVVRFSQDAIALADKVAKNPLSIVPGQSDGGSGIFPKNSLLGLAGFAAGGVVRSPLQIVGEQGPELAALPMGSRVFTAGQTSRMLRPTPTNSEPSPRSLRTVLPRRTVIELSTTIENQPLDKRVLHKKVFQVDGDIRHQA